MLRMSFSFISNKKHSLIQFSAMFLTMKFFNTFRYTLHQILTIVGMSSILLLFNSLS